MTAIDQLKDIAGRYHRLKFPHTPDYARCCHRYNDRTANGLTRCILDFLKFSGWQAERINCTGRPLDGRKVVTDVLGRSRQIGSLKWVRTTGAKGTADISATIMGKSIKIEIKMKDRQSPDQARYQSQVEASGGLYWLVRSFDEFKKQYNDFIQL